MPLYTNVAEFEVRQASYPQHVRDPCTHCPRHNQILATIELLMSVLGSLWDAWNLSGNAACKMPLHKCGGIWGSTGLISATCSWSMHTLSSTQSNLCNYRNNFIRIGFMWCIRWNLSENELLKIGPLSATALSMWWNSNMCEASCPRRVRDSYMRCPQHYQFLATTGLIVAIWGGKGSLLQLDCCPQHASPHKCAGNQTCIGMHALSSTLWHFHKIPCF